MTARESDFGPLALGFGSDDPEGLAAAGTDFVILSREPADIIGASPAVLPILPLKDTVVFPDTMTPLAVGQPRSVNLIDDILRGDKQVGLVASKSADIESPGPRGRPDHRSARHHPEDDQGSRRHSPDHRAGHQADTR